MPDDRKSRLESSAEFLAGFFEVLGALIGLLFSAWSD